ncbi:hypothetical protein CFC21_085821 [Triticum aestivum]|uniref:Uncharacterized protein n=3 Tax=Triticum TaxID=4564 RepID=A0A9R1B5Q0_TRITD|nr:hypothetical protein CFC21_085821 [Triticum aestivum]VAI52489.1 unnamed protein product [Triticum turgidum subsp. durum]
MVLAKNNNLSSWAPIFAVALLVMATVSFYQGVSDELMRDTTGETCVADYECDQASCGVKCQIMKMDPGAARCEIKAGPIPYCCCRPLLHGAHQI